MAMLTVQLLGHLAIYWDAATIDGLESRKVKELLCENTDPSKGRQSRSGHVVFRRPGEYATLFPGLREIDTLAIEGERHSVLSGRLSG